MSLQGWEVTSSTSVVEARRLMLRADRCMRSNGATVEPYYENVDRMR
jgi:hypothetical protein